MLALLVTVCAPAWSATVQGYVLDPNWYAPHPQLTSPQVYGTGQYEYGVAGNIANSSQLGFFEDTDIYGNFYKQSQPDGSYTLASWDTWWRSAYAFNQSLSGLFTPRVHLRLHANMWSYGPYWAAGFNEIGQTFVATGSSVVMVIVRSPLAGVQVTASIHSGGPNGPQIGPSRTFTSVSGPSDVRLIWSGGEVPTVSGQIYYLKLKAAGTSKAIFCDNDPIPDLSDPMPEGTLFRDGSAIPGMDLGVTICSDDDGILTNLWTRSGGYNLNGISIGQTFTARGVNLLSFVAWIPDSSGTYIATLYNSVGGAQIGTAKKNKLMRWGDPEVLWTWAPGECPLTPGNTYYIEVTKEGGGSFMAYGNPYSLYSGGQAYVGRVAQGSGVDIAGTIMEEESPGSATKATVQFTTYPAVALADRAARSVTVRWATDVASDSTVEYAAWNCPYTNTYYNSSLVTNHVATITGLEPNTLYHFRVKSAASGKYTAVTRDLVTATINETPNLLANPGFEEGSGASPRTITGWTCTGMDIKASDGSWFWGLPPYSGSWLCEAAANLSPVDGVIYQTVSAQAGRTYKFTAAVSSWMRENNTWKYDVWQEYGRLPYMRVGIDPYGGNNPSSLNVRWTPRFYSHLRYNMAGIQAVAMSNNVTVFISFGGRGGEWHLFGIDDCRLSVDVNYTPYLLADLKSQQPNGVDAQVANLIVTAVTSEAGAYYAETEDRTCGIKIVSSDTATVGQRVTVRGTLQTDSLTGERYLANATFALKTAASEPKPLAMLCHEIGGAAYGLIPAVQDSVGPHNTGLAIKVAGKVTVKGANYVFINDGSLSGYGLKVDMSRVSSALIPNVGQVVGLSGISSLYYAGGVKPLLIVRRASDVSPVYGP
jgi:hypothetical protein